MNVGKKNLKPVRYVHTLRAMLYVGVQRMISAWSSFAAFPIDQSPRKGDDLDFFTWLIGPVATYVDGHFRMQLFVSWIGRWGFLFHPIAVRFDRCNKWRWLSRGSYPRFLCP